MCGILGYISKEINFPIQSFQSALNRIQHRGPDDCGIWESSDHHIYFGHQRLSIIDLSPNGKQPFFDLHQKSVIVFNGEIYNYREIKQELLKLGKEFKSKTDTEVLLEAYLHWGPDFVQKLNGMWAFAIWDLEKKILFFSRDRSGKKPFHYLHQNSIFSFASQLKCLKQLLPLDWKVDLEAFSQYLHWGYVPGELCFYSPAKKLLPGHSGIYSFQENTLKIWRYWELPQLKTTTLKSEPEILSQLETLLTQSVAFRLEADVPIGILLSGGVDSSIIAALAAKIKGPGQVKTFCAKMTDSHFDESAFSRKVAQHLDTQHFELTIPPSSIDIMNELIEFFDEPFADPSLVPTYLLSKMVRQHVTVALGGDGGDEVFGGYGYYPFIANLTQKYHHVPELVWKILGKSAGRMLPAGVKGRNLAVSLQEGPQKSILHTTPYFDFWLKKRLLKKDIYQELTESPQLSVTYKAKFYDPDRPLVSRMTGLDFQTYLTDDILVKVDRASMAVALEIRAPYLDRDLVEFSYSEIPDELKVDPVERRKIQVKLSDKILPGILEKRKKQGFEIPIHHWFQDKQVQKKIRSWILDSRFRQYINPSFVEDLLKGQSRGRHNEFRLFSLCMVSLVLEDHPIL